MTPPVPATGSTRALAAMLVGGLLGLVLIGVGLTVWRLAAGPPAPAAPRLESEAETLERQLEAAAWTPLTPGDRPVYVVGPRDAVAGWLERDGAQDAGLTREIRVVPVFGERPYPGEAALLAELWLTRDPALARLWLRTRPERWNAGDFPDPASDLARGGVVEAIRRFMNDLGAAVRRPEDAGRWPLVFWRDGDGALSVCVCDGARAAAQALAELRAAPAPAAAPTAPPPTAATPLYPRLDGGSSAPALAAPSASAPIERPRPAVPAPRLPGDPPSANEDEARPRPEPAPATTRSRPAEPRPPRPGAPPQARRDADSLFF